MKTIPELPVIQISEDERTWLNEAWEIIMKTGLKPDYLALRAKLKGKIARDFKPLDINSDLVESNSNSTVPKLLGVLTANPKSDVLSVANKIVELIRDQLEENPETANITTEEIGKKLEINKEKIQAIMELLKYQFPFYSSAGGYSEKGFGHTTFGINAPHCYEGYMSFTSFEEIVNTSFKRFNDEKAKYGLKNHSEIIEHFTSSRANPFDSKVKSFKKEDRIFVNPIRIKDLKQIKSEKYDLTKLLALCNELNSNYNSDNFYSISLLIRTIINHVAPIFGSKDFSDVVKNYKSEGNSVSFQHSIKHLENSSRKIADSHAHSLIRSKEVLPTEIQIDFRQDLDVLLGEIVRILK